MHEESILTLLWICYTGFLITVISHLNASPCLLFGVQSIMKLEFYAFVRNCCVFFFFSSCQGCFLSSWNIKKLDSVYDEQMLTRRFRNLGKHINPTDMPYFLPLCSWLWFLWSFACCSSCWSGLFVSSARSFWVSLDGLLVHMLVCFCLLCLDSYVCTF